MDNLKEAYKNKQHEDVYEEPNQEHGNGSHFLLGESSNTFVTVMVDCVIMLGGSSGNQKKDQAPFPGTVYF